MSNDKTESISAKLRRVADMNLSGSPIDCAMGTKFGITCRDVTCSECKRDVLRAIADEIDREKRAIYEAQMDSTGYGTSPHHIIKAYAESMGKPMRDRECITDWLNRYYLPRPLFDDGEPVQFGDKYVQHATKTMDTVSSITWSQGDELHVRINHGGRCDASQRYRRELPVLDADGVPIEVGDTVYILPGEHCDKLPIKGFAAGDKLLVINILNLNYGTKRGSILARSEKGVIGYPAPEQVTHREQDSLKKLRDEMREFGEVGADCTSSILLEYADRLTALIELDGRDA